MTTTPQQDEKIASMKFSSVFPHYVNKITKKERTLDELHIVIEWLTGYSAEKITELSISDINFKDFFSQAQINPNTNLITGKICGYDIQSIENETSRQVRCLDKLVDELANGRKLEKILRS